MCATTIRSSKNPAFLEKATRWIQEIGEVTALIRYSHCAGNREWMICQDPKDFVTRLERLPPKASIIFFKARQFPLRGPVDVAEAMACIPDGTEFVVLIFDVSGQPIVEHRE